MGQTCTQGTGEQDEVYEMALEFEGSRLTLNNINIIEFEGRLKRYAIPENNGKITVDQLLTGFEGTGIFDSIINPMSVAHKLVFSPFILNFELSHFKKKRE